LPVTGTASFSTTTTTGIKGQQTENMLIASFFSVSSPVARMATIIPDGFLLLRTFLDEATEIP